jgi:hypothetical protein
MHENKVGVALFYTSHPLKPNLEEMHQTLDGGRYEQHILVVFSFALSCPLFSSYQCVPF